MKSMTGYGRSEHDNGLLKIIVEVKAVNHRYNEIVIKQPRQYLGLEDQIKKLVNAYIERGRVEVFVRANEMISKDKPLDIDVNKAISFHHGLKALCQQLGEDYQLDIYRLVTLPDVIAKEEKEDDMKMVWQVLEVALTDSLKQHIEMRIAEGSSIQEDLRNKLSLIRGITEKIGQRSPVVLLEYKDKLNERISELLESAVVNEERLAQEVAYFAEKSCIDEELVRLNSHFSQFEQIINQEGSIGRKLDFLIQEMNRETNTIGSKASDLEIGQMIVEMKSELEKIREQVQNIE